MSGRSKTRSSRRTQRQPKQKKTEGRRVLWTALLLFALALALRLLFWQATPDADWPHSAHFKGDAPTWAEYAASLRAGTGSGNEFELGLPLRPPGAAYLLAALWDPSGGGRSGLGGAQLAWCLLGALTVLLVYDAARRSFGDAVGLLAGLLSAVSHGLMVLSTSLNNETPYLFVVVCSVWMWARMCTRLDIRTRMPTLPWLCAWGALHGLACLIRVEHLLFFVLTTAWLVLQPAAGSWKAGLRAAARASLPVVLPVAAAFALVLLPWHVKAWQAVERFNSELPDPDSPAEAAQARLEQMLGPVRWTDEATVERDALPAFVRRAAANFVAATKLYRLGPSAAPSPTAPLVIEAADLDALDQAFGSRPEPLPAHPFVTFYGGLNFYLAHNPWAELGFSRAVLDQPPPLDPSQGPFPPILVDGLPPPTLAFTYPPHLHAVNHGYALGLRHILAEPGETARRLAQRLVIFWDGASLGFGGFGLPDTGDLLRRRADLAVPTGGVFRVWQIVWLGLVLAGLVFGLRRKTGKRPGLGPLLPWLALAATKLVASLAFFGYARHGAGAYPAVALLAALGLVGLARKFNVDLASASLRKRLTLGVATLGMLILALEVWRFADPPQLQLDGRMVQSGDPWPIDVHEDRILAR